MNKRMIFWTLIFLVFYLPNCKIFSQEHTLNTESEKNRSAGSPKINSEKISAQDLLNSPLNGDWLMYHGDYSAKRFSPLRQIDSGNVQELVPKWTYQINNGKSNLRSSPVVFKGIMYVTGSDEVHALDAATGTWLWIWKARNEKIDRINRGVAVYGDKIFFSTSDCYLVALNRFSGNLVWSKQYAQPSQGYYSTMAPLVVNGRVILGISNQNTGSRGFVAAFSSSTGKELWRFWATPEGVRGAPTWMTGSYDPGLDVLYWAVGNLKIDSKIEPKITAVYDNSVVALGPKNGKLIWATRLGDNMPYDWWDANEPLVLADLKMGRTMKKVVLQAHRNGMFFLINRVNGELLLSKPYVEKINWSRNDTCPSMWGATNWMSPSFSSTEELFYVMVYEGCMNQPNRFHVKAIEPRSGKIVWDYPTEGSNLAASGVLTTAGGLVFSGEGSGRIIALDAKSGKRVWVFVAEKTMFSSPMTFISQGRQFVSVVAGTDVLTFGLRNDGKGF